MAGCSGVSSTPEAPTPAAEATWSPAGEYNWTTSVEGMSIGGTLQLSDGADGLTGIIRPDAAAGVGDMTIDDIEVNGQEVLLTADTGMGGLMYMVLDFAGDSFTGSWSMDTMGGDIRGSRIP